MNNEDVLLILCCSIIHFICMITALTVYIKYNDDFAIFMFLFSFAFNSWMIIRLLVYGGFKSSMREE